MVTILVSLFCYTDLDMYIYFVRHGQSYGNINFVPGVSRPKTDPLTELGITQAKNAANYIASQEVKPGIIISSPYTRTVDTAIAIQKALDIPMKEDERLGEYDPGDWNGLPLDDYVKRFNDIELDERYTFRPPNGESWLDEANRINEVIEQAEKASQTCIVIVSHYDPIKAIISLLIRLPAPNWGDPADYPPGSVTVLRKTHSDWDVVQSQ